MDNQGDKSTFVPIAIKFHRLIADAAWTSASPLRLQPYPFYKEVA
jgi:hypothetical protein